MDEKRKRVSGQRENSALISFMFLTQSKAIMILLEPIDLL